MNIRKLFCPGNTPRILLFLFFFVVSVITTIACGYTEKNATGNVLLLFLLLLLAHRNTLTSITALLFLFCCALYAPAGMTYGKINNSFIVALLQTTTDEAAEFTGMIPVYHFLVSAAIQVFMVIFWRTHRRGHRNWLALLGFAPIFPDTCYHLTHYWLAAVDIPVASDNPVHYADAIRYNARTPLQGSLLPLTRLVWA